MPTLSGCWDRVELQDLAIITGLAIDRVDNEKIKVTAQIFIPRSITSGETGEDPGLGSTYIREGIGNNLANAISMLQISIPRRIFWGQCKIFIFGEEVAKQGIRDGIDFLARHPGPRGTSNIYVSEGEAKKILILIPLLERYSGEALKKLSQGEAGMKTTMRDIDIALMGEGESITLPYIRPLASHDPTRKPNQTIPMIEGTAVFRKDKMIGTLNMSETRGLLWLKDDVKRSTISVKLEGEDGEITMTPTLGSIKYKPEIKKDHWIMNLKLKIEGDIVQNETHLNLMNEDIIKRITKEYEKALKKRVSLTTDKFIRGFQTDAISFGRRFHEKYPQEWKQVKNNWDEKFPEVEVKISVNAKIRRPGYIGPPAALPRDEVEE